MGERIEVMAPGRGNDDDNPLCICNLWGYDTPIEVV